VRYNPLLHHRRSIRLKGYDYSKAGAYFITICCQDRECRFGKIENHEMILNEFGQIAYSEWAKTPELRKNVELDVFIVMPNHIHGIILITNNGNDRRDVLHTSNNNSSDNLGILHTSNNNAPDNLGMLHMSNNNAMVNRGVCNTPLRSPSQTIGAIVRGYKSSVAKKINEIIHCDNLILWQRNYYDIIIRNDQQYKKISDYIIDNPAKWDNDKFYNK
jgi:putative transposase